MITFACPKCHKLGNVPEQSLGKSVACPNCGQMVPVTLDELFTQPEATPPAPAGVAGPGDQQMPPQRGASPHAVASVPVTRFSRVALMPVLGGVALSVVFYLGLAAAQRLFGRTLTYPEKFISRGWTPYVCVFLASWALSVLLDRWIRAGKREVCLAASAIPRSASLKTEAGAQQVIGSVQEPARKSGDDLLARRVQGLVTLYRASRDPEAVAEELDLESEAAYNQLDSDSNSIRVVLWTVPSLGFIGTIIGIASAVAGFSTFLSVGAQELDDIKAALIRVTSSLAVAFDTTLVALMLSIVVMLTLAYVERKEKRVLQGLDDFCRQELLPHMFAAKAQAAAASEEAARESADVLRSAIGDLRDSLANFGRNAGQKWAEDFAKSRAEAGDEWVKKLDQLREDLGHAQVSYAELGKQFLDSGESVNKNLSEFLDKTQQLFVDLHDSLEKLAPSGPASVAELDTRDATVPIAAAQSWSGAANLPRLHGELHAPQAGAPAHEIQEFGSLLRELQDSVRSMNVFVQRLAERLQRLADQPHDVRLKVTARSSPANGG